MRRPAVVYVLTCAYVAFLLLALGAPFRDSRGAAAAYRHQHNPLSLGAPVSLRGTPRDLAVNVILFVPIGLLGRRSLRQAGVAALPALLVTVGGSIAVSLAMETLQYFIPGRYSSLVDVLMNAGGVAIGAVGDMAVAALLRLRS